MGSLDWQQESMNSNWMVNGSLASVKWTKLDTSTHDTQYKDSQCIGHGPCEVCGSRDNKATYDDGHSYCFGCKAYFPSEDETPETVQDRRVESRRTTQDFLQGEYRALLKRGLSEETCKKWLYQVGSNRRGESVHIANSLDPETREKLGQKLRTKDKKFEIIGDYKGLYGKWLWYGKDTRSLVITEGELDALSVSQAFEHKYPVVSIANGAATGPKSIQQEYEWVSQFDKIVLMFDMDDKGREAAEKVASLLPVGKVYVAKLDYKDANEVLVKEGPHKLVDAFWRAVPWRPDGIIKASDIDSESILKTEEIDTPYPWPKLNEVTMGLRLGELVTLTGGTGCGKSSVVREVAHHLLQMGEPVGMLMLEENNVRTMRCLTSLELNKNIVKNPKAATDDEIKEAYHKVSVHDLYLYNHFGSGSIDSILQRIRFLVRGCGVRWIFLDHLSILISGLAVGDERKQIDIGVTQLRTLVEELNCGLIQVSHLRKADGDKGHEDGAKVRLNQLRGSGGIGQLSDIVIGVQRTGEENEVELVVLKNRFTGDLGHAGLLHYNRDTGRLVGKDYF